VTDRITLNQSVIEDKHFRFFVAALLRMTWIYLRYNTYPSQLGERGDWPFSLTKGKGRTVLSLAEGMGVKRMH
jgi:hypothetical protein